MAAEANTNTKRRKYNAFENQLMIALVDTYKNAIESKETNAFANNKKAKAWESLTREFNRDNTGRPNCTETQLRNLYMSLKKRSTKKAALHRSELFKTGGGQKEIEITPIDEKLIGMGVIRRPLPTTKDTDGVLEFNQGSFFENQDDSMDESLVETEVLIGQEVLENMTTSDTESANNTKAPTSCLEPQFLNTYHKKVKRREPATAKAANAMHEQAVVRKTQIEFECNQASDKFSQEMKDSQEIQELKKKEIELRMELLKQKAEREEKFDLERFEMDKKEHELRMEILYQKLDKQ